MLDYTHPIEYIQVVWDWRILRENFGAINNRDIGYDPIIYGPKIFAQNTPIPYFLWVTKSAYRYLNLNSCISKPKSLKMVYIQRDKKRQIVNEKDVLNVLNKEMGLEVKVIRLEKLKTVSQVKLFSEADIAFGVHGAGFVNTMWMMPYSGLKS